MKEKKISEFECQECAVVAASLAALIQVLQEKYILTADEAVNVFTRAIKILK